MSDAQVLIRDAQDKAERLCALAVEQTPAAYQSFITLIEQRRKVGGTRQAPIFATVRQPYLSVDGRVKWARDEHLRAGKRFDVQTEFVVEATSGQLLARATLTSEIYGTAVAHARVFLGGDGVNESNPLETGETSAVGRALGMWGFGCYGTGIASAEEVLRVADRPDGSGPVPARGPSPSESPNGTGRPGGIARAADGGRIGSGGGAGPARPRPGSPSRGAGAPPRPGRLRRGGARRAPDGARRAPPERRHDARGAPRPRRPPRRRRGRVSRVSDRPVRAQGSGGPGVGPG